MDGPIWVSIITVHVFTYRLRGVYGPSQRSFSGRHKSTGESIGALLISEVPVQLRVSIAELTSLLAKVFPISFVALQTATVRLNVLVFG